MKKLILLLVLSLLGFIPLKSLAQLNVNVNIGSQPLWGPVGYEHVDYYYLPDIDSYYYVPRGSLFTSMPETGCLVPPSLPDIVVIIYTMGIKL
jgi:hypothetical protein